MESKKIFISVEHSDIIIEVQKGVESSFMATMTDHVRGGALVKDERGRYVVEIADGDMDFVVINYLLREFNITAEEE